MAEAKKLIECLGVSAAVGIGISSSTTWAKNIKIHLQAFLIQDKLFGSYKLCMNYLWMKENYLWVVQLCLRVNLN